MTLSIIGKTRVSGTERQLEVTKSWPAKLGPVTREQTERTEVINMASIRHYGVNNKKKVATFMRKKLVKSCHILMRLLEPLFSIHGDPFKGLWIPGRVTPSPFTSISLPALPSNRPNNKL